MTKWKFAIDRVVIVEESPLSITQWSRSLRADSIASPGASDTIANATAAKGSAPDVHLALLYACETTKTPASALKLKNAFLRLQTADAATGAFPLLLYYQTALGDFASIHTSKLLERLVAGDTLQDAKTYANEHAPLVTVGNAPNPMVIKGDDYSTAKFVYLNPTEYPSLTNRNVWFIVKKGGTIQ